MEWILIGLGIGIILFAIKLAASNGAKAAYDAALSELASTPSDAALRKKTLELGRVYSNILRNNKGVTTFDEVALMNDINAACGSGAHKEKGMSPLTIDERLKMLAELKAKGLISDTEYDQKRTLVLSDV